MRFAVDSNVLVYALDSSDSGKHEIALRIMERAPLLDCMLLAQCLAEFLNVVRRKLASEFPAAIELASAWAATMPVLPTTANHVLDGAAFAVRHKLQLFDSIIWQAASAAQVEVLLSEDMQDGLSLDGMVVIDPFKPANAIALEKLLPAANQ